MSYSVDTIVIVAANVCDVPWIELRNGSKRREAINARTIAADLMKRANPRIGCVRIARALGCSDHTSALYHLHRAARLNVRAWPEYKDAAAALEVV